MSEEQKATFPEIHSSERRFDMAPWLEEKADDAVCSLGRAIDAVRAISESTPEASEQLESLLDSLWGAAVQTTKIHSFAVGSHWAREDAKAVFDSGFQGYLDVGRRWGTFGRCTGSLPVQRRELATHEFASELDELIKGERSPNRTRIHELIRHARSNGLQVEKFEDLVESVTMGRVEWPEFQVLAASELERWK